MGFFQTKILEQVTISYSWIFLTQGSNLGLLHCRQILYCLRQNIQAKCLHLHSTLAYLSQLQDESGDIKSQGLFYHRIYFTIWRVCKKRVSATKTTIFFPLVITYRFQGSHHLSILCIEPIMFSLFLCMYICRPIAWKVEGNI